MSQYDPLWRAVRETGGERIQMTFREIGEICGFPLDHALLNCKRELLEYGYDVEKISMKEKWIRFVRR